MVAVTAQQTQTKSKKLHKVPRSNSLQVSTVRDSTVKYIFIYR